MSKQMRIDFVSDVSCPWCVIGLKALEQALDNVGDAVDATIHFQPFELNPAMVADGEDIGEHIFNKYGAGPAQRAESGEMIRARGEALGFEFGSRERIYNTFDAHRLLHWAELEGKQHALKMALFSACFTAGEDVSANDVLVRLAGQAGLDEAQATTILAGDTYAAEVREREQFFQRHGISAVPAIIINQKHLISGGQPPEVFEQAIRDIVAQA